MLLDTAIMGKAVASGAVEVKIEIGNWKSEMSGLDLQIVNRNWYLVIRTS
jgi:hypothetical protein